MVPTFCMWSFGNFEALGISFATSSDPSLAAPAALSLIILRLNFINLDKFKLGWNDLPGGPRPHLDLKPVNPVIFELRTHFKVVIFVVMLPLDGDVPHWFSLLLFEFKGLNFPLSNYLNRNKQEPRKRHSKTMNYNYTAIQNPCPAWQLPPGHLSFKSLRCSSVGLLGSSGCRGSSSGCSGSLSSSESSIWSNLRVITGGSSHQAS